MGIIYDGELAEMFAWLDDHSHESWLWALGAFGMEFNLSAEDAAAVYNKWHERRA